MIQKNPKKPKTVALKSHALSKIRLVKGEDVRPSDVLSAGASSDAIISLFAETDGMRVSQADAERIARFAGLNVEDVADE